MTQIQLLSKQASNAECRLANLNGATGGSYAGQVYDKDYLCPTLTDMQGGGRQPHIVEVKKLDVNEFGFINNGTGKHQSNIVYSKDGINPCICAGMGVKQQPTMVVDAQSLRKVRTEEGKALRKAYESGKIHHAFNEHRTAEPRTDGISNTITTVQKDNMIIEQHCVAMRGRNPDNPSNRTPGMPTEQRLELQEDNICNCLTSVQKDNLVLEVKTMLYINKYFDFIYSERVINERNAVEILCLLREKISEEEISEWSIRGLWCILAKEILQQNVYAKSVFKNWENKPELFQFSYYSEKDEQIVFTETQVREMWKDWQIRCSSYRWRLEQQHRRKFDDFVQELSYENSSSKEIVCYMWKTCKGIGLLQQALYSVQEIWQSLHSMGENYYLIRIRKLTPKSCWKLMSFSEEDYEKAHAVNSQTQLYKQAGNSICVNVLEKIFSQMIERN